jgi:3-hydroxyacyl-CoA dehydrogenase
VEGINKALDLAEAQDQYKGILIANEGNDFSTGADLGEISKRLHRHHMKPVKEAITRFQHMVIRMRYSKVPIVSAPHGITLGNGAEVCMYSDAVCAAADTFMGLVEVRAGLVPAGGGLAEFTRRAATMLEEGDPGTHHLYNRFMIIAEGKISTSAHEAIKLGYLDQARDEIVPAKERLITEAKRKVLALASKGYQPPEKSGIRVLGRNTLSFFYAAISERKNAQFITAHDESVLRKLAFVMCGGDVTITGEVSEQYLLHLEKDAFMELAGNKETHRKIEELIKTHELLRN